MREFKFRIWDEKEKFLGEPINLLYILQDAKNIKDWKNLIFMQYTGLKDKNDKEIYEGDIIYCKNNLREVIWDNERALFRCKNFMYILDEYLKYNPEIIGNIYESPEVNK